MLDMLIAIILIFNIDNSINNNCEYIASYTINAVINVARIRLLQLKIFFQ